MAAPENMTARDKKAEEAARSFDQNKGERSEDAFDAPDDLTNHKAMQEASRLGGGDTYLVESDLEDMDERLGEDGADGRPSPMANADNPER